MGFILAADATFENINNIPSNLVRVGYTTGSQLIKWPAEVFKPADIRICQDFGSDPTADELDVEPGAATNLNAAQWYLRALHYWQIHERPGQRPPMLYTFMNNLTPMVNTLIANGINKGPYLHLAQPGDTLITAEDILAAASGPFPVGAIQYKFAGAFDLDVYSSEWYTNISGKPKPAFPPGQWNDPNAWTWTEVFEGGLGLDGKLHAFHFNQAVNVWDKLA